MRYKLAAAGGLLVVVIAGAASAGSSFIVTGTWDVAVKCKGYQTGVPANAKLTGTLAVLQSVDGATSVDFDVTSDEGPLGVFGCGVTTESITKPGKGHVVFAASDGTTYLAGDLAAQTFTPDGDGISGKIKGAFSLATPSTYLRCKVKGKRNSQTPPALSSCSPT